MDATQNLEGAIKSYGKTKPSWVFDPVATAPGPVFVDPQVHISSLPGDNECRRGLFVQS